MWFNGKSENLLLWGQPILRRKLYVVWGWRWVKIQGSRGSRETQLKFDSHLFCPNWSLGISPSANYLWGSLCQALYPCVSSMSYLEGWFFAINHFPGHKSLGIFLNFCYFYFVCLFVCLGLQDAGEIQHCHFPLARYDRDEIGFGAQCWRWQDHWMRLWLPCPWSFNWLSMFGGTFVTEA